MQRIIALDIGKVRIGVAVSDPLGLFAQGIAVLQTHDDWTEQLRQIAEKYSCKTFLVGLPKRTNGQEGPETEYIRAYAEKAKEKIPNAEIIFWDERFTTVIAQQVLISADVSRSNRKKSVDKIAATVLLQGYLDNKRS